MVTVSPLLSHTIVYFEFAHEYSVIYILHHSTLNISKSCGCDWTPTGLSSSGASTTHASFVVSRLATPAASTSTVWTTLNSHDPHLDHVDVHPVLRIVPPHKFIWGAIQCEEGTMMKDSSPALLRIVRAGCISAQWMLPTPNS